MRRSQTSGIRALRALGNGSGVMVLVALLLLTMIPTGSAEATVPGTPGVAQPGTTVFSENFENNPAPTAVNYSTYVGALPVGATYTGSPKWINGARCNGVVLAYANSTTPIWAQSGNLVTNSGTNGLCSDSAGVRSYQFLRMLALAMGQQFTPGSPTANHVVSSYTECQSSSTGGGTCDTLPVGSALANGSVMFRTVQPITTVPGHYYVFGVDTAYMNCGLANADPGYQFATVNPVTGATTNLGQPLNGCQATSNPNVTASTQSVTSNVGGNFGTVTKSVRINSMTTNQAFQAAGTSMGLQMHNTNGTTNGNDGAFDNIRLVDVTPQIDKSFSPALVAPGQPSTVTLTITNTSELNAKNDWSITDTLPAGLVIAPTPAVGGTCAQLTGAAFVRTATAGSGTFTATGGDLAAGQVSCTITFNVTAAAEGTYVNGPGNIVSNLNPPADATLVVKTQSVRVNKLWTIKDPAGNTIGTYHVPAQPGDTAPMLPTGFTAVATVNGTDTAWGAKTSGYAVGAQLAVNERNVSVPPGCTLGSSRVTSVNGTALGTPAGLPYSATVTGNPADQTFEITNSVTCTQRLTLVKQVGFGSASPTAWTLTGTGPQSALPGPSGTSGNPGATANVTPGIAYALAESGGPNTYVPTSAGWQCTASTGTATPNNGAVTLRYGQSATCTITNTTARVTVLKHIAGTGLDADQFRLGAVPGDTALAAHTGIVGAETANGSNTFEIKPGATYTLSEESIDSQLPYLYLGLRKSVDGGTTWTDVTDVDVQVPAGTHVYYQFVNQSVPEVALPLTGGTGSLVIFLGAGIAGAVVVALLLWRHRRGRELRV